MDESKEILELKEENLKLKRLLVLEQREGSRVRFALADLQLNFLDNTVKQEDRKENKKDEK